LIVECDFCFHSSHRHQQTVKKAKFKPASPRELSRRSFLTSMLASGAVSLFVPGCSTRNQAPSRRVANGKVNLACVGIGNRGADVILALQKTGLANVVALCDTQLGAKHTLGILDEFPNARQFRDFRNMFDAMAGEIDAVAICTPDHSHFPITMLAMSLGKHVYVEKPMAHSFRQIELMMAGERKYKVACQMGNQGHSDANYFQFKAWTEAGIIRNVTKITAFMNSSRRWHGLTVSDYLPEQPLPEAFDWDCWLATALKHPFNRGYLNGDWRAWFDYGNGAIGDWGAHIMDTAHEFLQLGLPTEVDPLFLEGHNAFIFPQASTIRFKFPARGSLPPVELTWHDGKDNLPPRPDEWSQAKADAALPRAGKVIHGENLTFIGESHGNTLEILNPDAAKDLNLPPVPESPSNHFLNFLRACRGEEKCRSNFAVAGPLCQVMALAVIAQRVNARFQFDPATRRITNHKVADALLDGAPPRKEWAEFYRL
jgi:predicted dehydrogenase